MRELQMARAAISLRLIRKGTAGWSSRSASISGRRTVNTVVMPFCLGWHLRGGTFMPNSHMIHALLGLHRDSRPRLHRSGHDTRNRSHLQPRQNESRKDTADEARTVVDLTEADHDAVNPSTMIALRPLPGVTATGNPSHRLHPADPEAASAGSALQEPVGRTLSDCGGDTWISWRTPTSSPYASLD